MIRCPNCREEINHLEFTSQVREYGITSLYRNRDGEIDTDDHDTHDSETQETSYQCPECSEDLNASDCIWEEEETAQIEPNIITFQPRIAPDMPQRTQQGQRETTDVEDMSLTLFINGTTVFCEECKAYTRKEEGEETVECEHCDKLITTENYQQRHA